MDSIAYLVEEMIIMELQIAEEKDKECDDKDGKELLDEVSYSYSFY